MIVTLEKTNRAIDYLKEFSSFFFSYNREFRLNKKGKTELDKKEEKKVDFTIKSFINSWKKIINWDYSSEFLDFCKELKNEINSTSVNDSKFKEIRSQSRNILRIYEFLKVLLKNKDDFGIVVEKLDKNSRDFKFLKRKVEEIENNSKLKIKNKREYYRIKKDSEKRLELLYRFELYCLNPKLLFKEIIKSSKAIILCSGTLQPLNLRKKILGTEGAYSKTWNSVIPKERSKLVIIPADMDIISFFIR